MINAFIAKLTKQEKTILYVTITIVAITLVDAIFLRPVQQESRSIKEEIEEKRAAIRQSLRVVKNKDKIITEEQALSSYYANPSLKTEELIASLLKEVETKASLNSVALINVNPTEVKEAGLYYELNLTLDCEAKMDNLLKFMYDVDSSDKLMKVVSFTLSPKNKKNYEVKCTLTIVMMVLYPKDAIARKLVNPLDKEESSEESSKEKASGKRNLLQGRMGSK